jgi:vacuolar-type H+-ATPase subunit H
MTTENLENKQLSVEETKRLAEQLGAYNKEKTLDSDTSKPKVSPAQKRYQEVEAYYSKKLNELVHEHFMKVTSDTDQEQLEAILKEGHKKWLAICARSHQVHKNIITLNINAFTDFLKDAMDKK